MLLTMLDAVYLGVSGRNSAIKSLGL